MANEKSDRELLELAAKAVGYSIRWGEKFPVGGDEVDCTDLAYVESDSPDESPAYWNPLEDGGDALHLAVALRLKVTIGHSITMVEHPRIPDVGVEHYEGADAATRRAIVRAAAAIGEQA